MPEVKIFKPAKTAMQSGKAKTKIWMMEFINKDPEYIDPIMNWVGSNGTNRQFSLTFDSKESAINFAADKGWSYIVYEPQQLKFVPKSYVDNFRPRV